MKQIDIQTNTFWGIWSSLTRNEMPSTTCGLAWHMIFSLLTFPLWVFPGLIINGIIKLFNKHNDVLTCYWYILINVVVTIIGAIYHDGKKIPVDSFLQLYWNGLWIGALVVVGIVVVVLLIFGVVEGSKWLWNKATSTIPEENTIHHMYYSLKDKHCSRINWK